MQILLPYLYLPWKFLVLEVPSLLDLVVKLKKQVNRLSNISGECGIENNFISAQQNRPLSRQSSHRSSSSFPTDSDVETEQLVSMYKVNV